MPEPRDSNDFVSTLYILGGIPAMVAFFVVFFVLVQSCDLPG